MQSINASKLGQRAGRPLLLAACLLPLLIVSKPAGATDTRIYTSGGHRHDRHSDHDYRTRQGFALSYGVGGRHHDNDRNSYSFGKSYSHYQSPYSFYFGQPYSSKKVYPSRQIYGYPGYGRPFNYYHRNARDYNYQHGYRDGYLDGRRHDGDHRRHHSLGRD